MYFVDRMPQLVLKFSKEGRHRLSLGKRGVHSDTGYTQETRIAGDPLLSGGGLPDKNGVGFGGPPFHHPTDVSASPTGEIYVSDGYRNSRVHKYSPDGTLLKSWGEPGNAGELRDTKDKPGFWERNGYHMYGDHWEEQRYDFD